MGQKKWTAGGFSDSACLCFRLPSSDPRTRFRPRRECDTLGLSEDGHDCISALGYRTPNEVEQEFLGLTKAA